jgi:hypothetical protein
MLPAVMMAEALVSVGRDKDALALVTRMLDELPTPEIGIFVSELWRLRGELVLRHLGNDARPEVERYLATALRIAQSQGAPVYNLRAGISLARLLAETGRRAQAGAVIDAAAIKELGDWNGLEAAIACQLISDVS